MNEALRLIDDRRPVGWHRDRPWFEYTVLAVIASVPGAGPAPIFHVFNKTRPKRILFNVARDHEKAPFRDNWEGLVSALVQRTGPHAAMSSMPPLRLGHGEPLHEARELHAVFGPQEQVPVIWHDREREHPHSGPALGAVQDAHEVAIVVVGRKDDRTTTRAIQDMMGKAGGSETSASWHLAAE